MSLLLIASVCLFVVLSRAVERVSPGQCVEIRKNAEHWKPSPSDHYNDADQITKNIFLGNVCAAHNDSWLDEENITVVISVASEWPELLYRGKRWVQFYHFPMEDTSLQSERVVRRTMRVLATLIHHLLTDEEDNSILVHCNMGISRSSAVVIHYLQEYEMSSSRYRSIEAFVREKRPVIKPNALFRRILVKEDL